MHTIMVLGGYGFFGRRICAALAREPGVRLLVAGRNHVQAQDAAAALGLPREHGTAIDARAANLALALRARRVNTLIHTAGPYQHQDYAVARAALSGGCHYIDLADGRAFACGITALDADARAAGLSIISGASSVPGLSSAVIERYRDQFSRIDSIRIGIASGARAPGIATVRGIFGYCGQPIRRWEQGQWRTTHGWHDLRTHRFPAPVGTRLMGSIDVPDLELFPARYGAQTVTAHAGFASAIGHLTVYALAWLARLRLIGSVALFATPLNHMSRWLEPVISDKGGMFVELRGAGLDGAPLERTWRLLAANNDGPHIPCGAAIALARKLARGEPVPRGAMACAGLLSVDEYLAPLRDLAITEIPA